MAVPKPPNFDAAGWSARLEEAIPKRLDGTPIAVWDQLPPFVKWLRGQRDHLEALRVGVFGPEGIKPDLDSFRENNGVAHNSFNSRLAALEAQQNNVPFPGSG